MAKKPMFGFNVFMQVSFGQNTDKRSSMTNIAGFSATGAVTGGLLGHFTAAKAAGNLADDFKENLELTKDVFQKLSAEEKFDKACIGESLQELEKEAEPIIKEFKQFFKTNRTFKWAGLGALIAGVAAFFNECVVKSRD